MWELQCAPFIGAYRKRAARGLPVPALANRPQLKPELAWVMESFQMLSAHRQGSGFGLNPLSIADIEAYSRMIGVTGGEEQVALLDLLTALDSAYLSWSVKDLGNDKESNAQPFN